MPRMRVAVAYLWLQAAAVAVWWLTLWLWPSARPPFTIGDWPESTLLTFALPDLVGLVAGSAFAAGGLARGCTWARPLLWAVAGGIAYATLWCGGALLATGSGWLSLALMVASLAGTTFAVVASHREAVHLASRSRANSTSSGQNAAKSPSSAS